MSQSLDPTLHGLNDCGCCDGRTVPTPVMVENRPGLNAVAYRVGVHPQFLEAMLARLSSLRYPALQDLTTRDKDDFTVALLDAWATVGDVLTFYQERIANESYLRTATERRSVTVLARLIGYQPSPGVAAETFLAFTLEDAPGSPDATTIGVGTKVQSIPGQDEQPQTFETIETIEARPEWNRLKPRLTRPQDLQDGTPIWLHGVDLSLKPGDALLITTPDSNGALEAQLRRIVSAKIDHSANRTVVVIETPTFIKTTGIVPRQPGLWVLRLKAAPFGHNAPKEASYNGENIPIFVEWNLKESDKKKVLTLDTVYDDILPGSLVLVDRPRDTKREHEIFRVSAVQTLSRADYGIAGRVTKLTLNDVWLPGLPAEPKLSVVRETVVYAKNESLRTPEEPDPTPVMGNSIEFGDKLEGLLAGRKVIVQGKRGRARIGNSEFPLTLVSSKDPSTSKPLEIGEELIVLSPPVLVPSTSSGDTKWHLMDAAGFEGFVSVYAGSGIEYVPSTKYDPTVTEIATLQSTELENEKYSRLTLNNSLQNVYDRPTVTIYANVTAATHGETVQEVLGSGDASQSYQRFTLRQPPLTHVSAPTPNGTDSTLQIRVNDLLWHETSTLYGRGPKERVFITRTDGDGKTSIQFGDGATGARLPSGQNNVRAKYRKGIGLGGLVKAEQLSLLMTRPLGLKDVTNPLAANGAADPEPLNEARQNAPLSVLTLDRAVSLKDYEDFTRSFAGIAKALATWTWDGQTRGVFITVAGPGGAEIPKDGTLYENLMTALAQAGDPFVKFWVEPHRKALFRIAAKVKVDRDYMTEKVLKAVEQSLRARFAFDAREFGQPVTWSDVMAAVQAVDGVKAVDLDNIYRVDETGPARPRRHWVPRHVVRKRKAMGRQLSAAMPVSGDDGEVMPAELLVLDPGPLDLGVI